MKVLVTGGAGLIGKATTARLLKNGWDVKVIGLEPGIDAPGAEFVNCDILNYEQVREQVRGCQYIVHLAAIRSPILAPGHKLFNVNVTGTFNIFEAAAAEGIRRVVQASSINAYGCAYSLVDIAPPYFPMDEDQLSNTTDPYSYSKELIEDMGRYFWRREGISSLALRFPWVYEGDMTRRDDFRQRQVNTRAVLDEFIAMPDAERAARLANIHERGMALRRTRPLEFKDAPPPPINRNIDEDPLFFIYTFDRFNFWAFLDVRDAAQSIEKGLTAEFDGAHALYVNDDHNWLGYESRTLVKHFFSHVPDSKIALAGTDALLSIERARKMIGFSPEYSIGDGQA